MTSSLWLAAVWTAAGAASAANGGLPGASATPIKGANQDGLWLAVRAPTASTCPPGTAGWTLRPNPGVPFERYCAYEFTYEPLEPTPDPSALSHPDLEGLVDASDGLVRPHSTLSQLDWPTPMAQAMAPHLWSFFAQRVQLASPPALISGPPLVRLAIVDTMPPGAPNPNSSHAPTLGAIAEAIACPSAGGCALDITYELALPRLAHGALDRLNGGHYGTLWELALAIAAATRNAAAAGVPRLVINLSLGFDAHGQPALPINHLGLVTGSSSLPAPLRAVHAAIVYARCQGALVLAASGNDDLGVADRSGPLLPAGWQEHASPTAAQCAGYPGGLRLGALPSGPLVTAVGGLDHLDRPVENALPGSTPELVAPASAAVAPGGGAVLTGTSVGAVVASAAVSLVWAIQPAVVGETALGQLRSASAPLPWKASFCPGRSSCPSARRISLCSAQQAACGDSAGCPPIACPVESGAGAWPAQMFYAGGMVALGGQLPSPWRMGRPQTVSTCKAVRAPSGWSGSLGCPLDDKVAARQLDAGPQPLDPMCPACFVIENPSQVLLALDLLPDIPGGALHDVHLQVTNGTKTARYALPGPFGPGHNEVFDLSATGWAQPVTEVWLQYVVYENGQPFAMGEPLILE